MPTYCFSSEDGEVIEEFFEMGKAPTSICRVVPTCRPGVRRARKEHQKLYKRDFAAEQTGRPARAGWPLTCFASGVNASQAGELRDHFKEVGVPTEVTADGDCVYTSHLHRKRALACRGIHDSNSFC